MKLINCNKIDALQIASKILNFKCYEIIYESTRTSVHNAKTDDSFDFDIKTNHRITKEQFYWDGIGYMKKAIVIDNGIITNIRIEAIKDLENLIHLIIMFSEDVYDDCFCEYEKDDDEHLSAHIFDVSNEQIAYVNPME